VQLLLDLQRLLLRQQPLMQDLVNLTIHLVIEVRRLPNEVASTRERLVPRQLSPIPLLIQGRPDDVVAIAGKYDVVLLDLPRRLHLLMDVPLVLQLCCLARRRQGCTLVRRWSDLHEFVKLLLSLGSMPCLSVARIEIAIRVWAPELDRPLVSLPLAEGSIVLSSG